MVTQPKKAVSVLSHIRQPVVLVLKQGGYPVIFRFRPLQCQRVHFYGTNYTFTKKLSTLSEDALLIQIQRIIVFFVGRGIPFGPVEIGDNFLLAGRR
jgi:hypothetical protein